MAAAKHPFFKDPGPYTAPLKGRQSQEEGRATCMWLMLAGQLTLAQLTTWNQGGGGKKNYQVKRRWQPVHCAALQPSRSTNNHSSMATNQHRSKSPGWRDNITFAFSRGVNFKTCTKGFLNGGAWSIFFPSPSTAHCLLLGSLILHRSSFQPRLQMFAQHRKLILARKGRLFTKNAVSPLSVSHRG